MEAVKYYQETVKEDPSYRPAFQNLGALYSEMGQPDLALGFYKQALDLGQDAAIYFNMAGEFFRLEKFKEAESYLIKALKLERKMVRAHLLLAYLYGKTDRQSKAEIYFKNVLTLDKNNRMAHLGMCILKSETEKYEEALGIADRYLSLSPEDISFRDLKAGLLLKLNRIDDSLDLYTDLSKKSEKFTSFTSHLKQAKQEAGREYEKFFAQTKDKIQEKNTQLKQKIEMRKKESRKADESEHKEDMKDLVDLSLLHLFNGDSEKALKYLFHAKKVNQNRQTKP